MVAFVPLVTADIVLYLHHLKMLNFASPITPNACTHLYSLLFPSSPCLISPMIHKEAAYLVVRPQYHCKSDNNGPVSILSSCCGQVERCSTITETSFLVGPSISEGGTQRWEEDRQRVLQFISEVEKGHHKIGSKKVIS